MPTFEFIQETVQVSHKQLIIDYEALPVPEKQNVAWVASVVANTILYNLAFVPDDVFKFDYTQSAISSFAREYITKFTTPDNIWHDETPLYALDTRSIEITLGMVVIILLYNNIELDFDSTSECLPFGYILDEIAGTVTFDEDTSWVYIAEIRIGIHSTALLANIESYMSNKTGETIRYLYRKDINVNPENYKKLYKFVAMENDNTE
jgi:hypothetical protein